jgi:hypothetical protein
MRDLAKSAFSFTWAMSLFGAKQAAGLITQGKTVGSFDSVTKAAVDTFDQTFQTAYRVGDGLQRSAVDAAFAMMSGNWNPAKILGLSSAAIQQAADATRQAAQAAASGTTDQGWGPVPPAK